MQSQQEVTPTDAPRSDVEISIENAEEINKETLEENTDDDFDDLPNGETEIIE